MFDKHDKLMKSIDEQINEIDKKISDLEKEENKSELSHQEYLKEKNKQNEKFYKLLTNKDSFLFDWYEGAILPKEHPNYFKGRIEVSINKLFDNISGVIKIEKDEYELSNDLFIKLYNYIRSNFDNLIKISLNQKSEMYAGGDSIFRIKYKSVFIDIDENNISFKEELEFINKLKEDIKKIITERINSDDSIEKLTKEVFTKIVQLPVESEFTIKSLVNNNYMYSNKIFFEVYKNVSELINKNNVNVISKYGDNAVIGLPFDIPLIKK